MAEERDIVPMNLPTFSVFVKQHHVIGKTVYFAYIDTSTNPPDGRIMKLIVNDDGNTLRTATGDVLMINSVPYTIKFLIESPNNDYQQTFEEWYPIVESTTKTLDRTEKRTLIKNLIYRLNGTKEHTIFLPTKPLSTKPVSSGGRRKSKRRKSKRRKSRRRKTRR